MDNGKGLSFEVKLQFAIAHYYDPEGDGRHGSLSPFAKPRVEALRETILQLHRLFGRPSGVLNHYKRRVELSEEKEKKVDIAVCVCGNKNLLGELGDLEKKGAFRRVLCNPSSPKYLGFKCQEELSKEHLNYDYSCYLEDDIVIRDADFFKKLRAFNRCFGNEYLLQPNRIETSLNMENVSRFYIDGDYNPKASEAYRNSMEQKLCIEHLSEQVSFRQPLNCHSGCFFLNKEQSKKYFSRQGFAKEEATFHGPLESAATLGIMREFEIVKPEIVCGQFLTVEHASRNFIDMIEKENS